MDDDSRVSRLRRSGEGGALSRRPHLDYSREFITALVFIVLLVGLGALFAALLHWSRLDRASDSGLILAFALGIVVTCALASSLSLLIALRHKLLLVMASALAVTVAAIIMDLASLEGLAKILLATGTGLWISLMLTSISQIVLIAGLIILVDFYSVFLGPTRKIVESGSSWIDYLTISLPVFGAPASSQIGISDIIFFSLFIGVALTWRLRRTMTAVALTASFVTTMIIGVRLEIGLPALPLLSVSFLLANADLLYRRFLSEPDEHKKKGG
jgi:hypothetical protein